MPHNSSNIATRYNYFADIARNWDLPNSRTQKLNPANPPNLICDISGRPEPSYSWTYNTTDSLPSLENSLSFQENSRQDGDIELITCKGVVGEHKSYDTNQMVKEGL